MFNILIQKTKKNMVAIFGQYAFRKIFSFIFIVLSTLSIAFTLLSIKSFNEFADNQKNVLSSFYVNPELTAPGQRIFLTSLFTIIIIASIMILFLSIFSFGVLVMGKADGYSQLRAITWIALLGIVGSFVTLSIISSEFSFRDPLVLREEYIKQPNLGKVQYPGADFSLIWGAFAMLMFTSITSGIIRKEYGSLEKDASLKKYEKFKNENKTN